MINPKKDRYVYSDILKAPDDFVLEKAVATTYGCYKWFGTCNFG